MKIIEAINKAYEKAHIYGGCQDVQRTKEETIIHVYGDGVCQIFLSEISVDDINADDWEIPEKC